jgi:hypothetical protein
MVEVEWNGFKVFTLVLIMILAITSFVLSIVLINEYLIVYKTDAKLEVEEAYFKSEESLFEDTELQIFVLVTNIGDKDCDTHVRAYVVNKETNIAMDDSTTEEVKIEGQSTHESSFNVMVPSNGRYRVEFLVYKNDMITVKGEGHVDLKAGGSEGRDYWTSEDDETESKASLSTPFLGPSAIFLVVIVFALVVRRWRK